jgi:mono/diheme cytochrome c family protein
MSSACIRVVLALLSFAAGSGIVYAQIPKTERSGAELYVAACAACHASDGSGSPQSLVGFDDPIPDFTECSFATPEAAADWFAVAHAGGPVRAFSRRMPSFGAALSAAELERVIDHVRGFCDDPTWPRGELNLPRALVTEKAYPENEALLTTAIQKGAAGEFTNEFIYERRFGARNQFEVAVPLTMQANDGDRWLRGLGDIAVAVKRVMYHDLRAGSIVSLGGELVLPTGKEGEGLGGGAMVFEPFVSAGQILPHDSFVQAQVGLELPRQRDHEREAFWRGVFGVTFVQAQFGRSWTPMIEVAATRELERGQRPQWDILPQLQVSLSKRQHILVSGGVRIPINEREERHPQVLTYLLWDWFDGGFRDGWR